MDNQQLDTILTLQLAVAHAGETDTAPPRLGWWRSSMCDEFGGEDLLRRLTPRTWRWGVLETARAAAIATDERLRRRAEDPENLVTLYRLGFEVDEQVGERLRDLKQREATVEEALPSLAGVTAAWSRDAFESFLRPLGDANVTATITGRRLRGVLPEDPVERARQLAAGLLPLDAQYVLPHYRIRR
jgi:hypothetical protein